MEQPIQPVWPRACGIIAIIVGVPGVPRGAWGIIKADVAAWKRAP